MTSHVRGNKRKIQTKCAKTLTHHRLHCHHGAPHVLTPKTADLCTALAETCTHEKGKKCTLNTLSCHGCRWSSAAHAHANSPKAHLHHKHRVARRLPPQPLHRQEDSSRAQRWLTVASMAAEKQIDNTDQLRPRACARRNSALSSKQPNQKVVSQKRSLDDTTEEEFGFFRTVLRMY